MINVLIIGTEASSYIFDEKINPYFNKNLFSVTLENNKITNLSFVKYKNKKFDVIIFDLVLDAIETSMDILKPKLINSLQKLENQFTNTKIIYNQIKYGDKTLIDNVWDYDNVHPIDSFISKYSSYAWERNKKLSVIDDFVKSNFSFNVMYYDNEISGVEFNNKETKKEFTYNENFYLEKLTSLYLILQGYDGIPLISILNFPNITDQSFEADILLVKGIDLYSRESKEKTTFLKRIMLQDFILDGRYGKTARFVRRTKFYRSKYSIVNNVYHILEYPKKNKNNNGIDKIIFYFYGLNWHFDPNGSEIFSPSYLHPHLDKSIVPDTLIIRIADVNAFLGSWYHNTDNNPNFENNVQKLIRFYQEKYDVLDENVVLFGVSRGGHASLYYGKKMDLPVISVAPPLDIKLFWNNENWHDYNDLWTDNLNFFLEEKHQCYPKVVIDDESVSKTFLPLSRIRDSTTYLFNLKRNEKIEHGQVAGLSVPLQYSLLNGLLMGYVTNESLKNWLNGN